MKCLNQNCDVKDIEEDDNFCYKCGHWTPKGYKFLNNKENINIITNGKAAKKDGNLILMVGTASIAFITFGIMCIFRGNDLFKPFYYLKRQINSYVYGYNVAFIDTEKIYNKVNISNINEAKEFITKDLNNQSWKCTYALDNFTIESELEKSYSIPSVSLCDVPNREAIKIREVIDKMFNIFPKMKGALTNISITNAKTNKEYIARFQPIYQFVNPNEKINSYNKVNKTQIVLNSYYFLNENIISEPVQKVVGDNWYVKDATWESTIAHELGHYISFVTFLKSNGLENVILVTEENENKINEIITIFDSGEYSLSIVKQALKSYNVSNNTDLDIDSFALTISEYAAVKDNNGDLIADETIAEAIHDYYLHGNKAKKASIDIVDIIKSRL